MGKIQKILAVVCSAAVVTSMAATSVSAAAGYAENFDSYADTAAFNNSDEGKAWDKASGFNGGGDLVLGIDAGALTVTNDPDGGSSASILRGFDAVAADKVVVSFDMKITQDTGNSPAFVRIDSNGNVPIIQMDMLFNHYDDGSGTDEFVARLNGANGNPTIAPIELNKYYSFKFVIDFASQSFDVYMAEQGADLGTALMTAQPFKDGVSGQDVSAIEYGISGGAAQIAYLDNVAVAEEGAAPETSQEESSTPVESSEESVEESSTAPESSVEESQAESSTPVESSTSSTTSSAPATGDAGIAVAMTTLALAAGAVVLVKKVSK
ncbi:MAG TPA: hypothetical protein H9671_03585 [Firmicutes bacterium]|nr:hypothetical protein [Bacillota bacterium]